MKRESLITKLVAFMLCVMMVVGCLPVGVFAAESDWEGDIDVVEPPVGSQENPIIITLTYNEENTVGTYEAAAQEGTTYYQAYMNGDYEFAVAGEGDFNVVIGDNTIAAVDGVASTTVSGLNRFTPFEFAIDGSGEFTVTFSIPVGAQMNPEELVLGYNDVSLEENSQGYYYTWTAQAEGDLTFEISSITEGVEADIVINNNTSYANRTLAADGVEDDFGAIVVTMPVAAGDEVSIQVVVMPDDSYSYPAADITHYSAFTYPLGTEQNPVAVEWIWNESYTEATATVSVPEGSTYYFGDYSITAENILTANGETVTVTYGNRWTGVPSTWTLSAGEYELVLKYLAGTASNPGVAVLGDNVASIAAGGSEYFWNYTAEKDGDLVITVSTASGNWQYTVNNNTTYVYGDTQWSDSDPVVNPTTITVAAGDVIEIKVLTYDPENPWSAPEGTITTNLAYEVTGPVYDSALVFSQTGLSFQEFIGIQPAMKNSVASTYDRVYIAVEHVTWDRTVGAFVTTNEEIEGARYGTSNVFRFTKKIMAWAMSESVTITLYAEKDGVTYYGQTVETSVARLALEKLAQYDAAGNTTACTALANMLTYGAAVQTQYNHNTDNLADADIGDYSTYVTTGDTTLNATNTNDGTGTVTVNLNSVSMQAQVEIQFGFKNTTDISGYEIRYTVGGVTESIPASEFAVVSSYNVAKIAVKAANLREVYTVALYDATTGEAVSAIYTVSVEAYAQSKFSATPALINALMHYGDAVAAL